LGARKGQISIDFVSIQDLNRILDEIGEPGYSRV
jgi:ParB family chromosome partitioning protein